VSGGDVDRVLWELRSGKQRADAQAHDWAGKKVAEVLGLDIKETSTKARVKMMLKRWEQNGALKRVRRPDPKSDGHERDFYEAVDVTADAA
jgi:hypothetical protein